MKIINRKTTAAPPGGQKRNKLTPVDHMCNIKAIGQVVVEMKKFIFFQKSIKFDIETMFYLETLVKSIQATIVNWKHEQ